MIRVDLVTGFLGSGKTTFLRHYARYLTNLGEKVCILENDYGAINVDRLLLQDLEGDRCSVEMIVGGDGPEAHRRRLKTKLIAMAMLGYDRVVVEPSGVYDVDEFFDILYEEPLDRWYETGSVIAVVPADAGGTASGDSDISADGASGQVKGEASAALTSDVDLNSDGSAAAREYFLMAQAAAAGCVLFSRVQECSEEQIETAEEYLQSLLVKYHCAHELRFLAKDWNDLTQDDFAMLSSCGYRHADHVKIAAEELGGYESHFYFHPVLSREQLLGAVGKAFSDPSCGKILRIKGCIREGADSAAPQWLSFNATAQKTELQPVANGQEVVIIIGEGLHPEVLDRYFK